MKIFVGGSLQNIEKNEKICHEFVVKLGELIMERGHILLNGCSGSLDKKIAESAAAWLKKNNKDPKSPYSQIHSYLIEGADETPIDRPWSVFISVLKDWSLSHESLEVPEQINLADVAIFIGGTDGTLMAANWARIARKPILGIGMFGGSGYKINKKEKQDFENKYTHLLGDSLSYGDLKQITKDVDRLANIVISISEDLMRSSIVFSIMSFKKEYNDVFDIFSTVCGKHDFKAIRTDHDPNLNPITNRILDGIKKSGFVIADVSEMSPNVFYEIGYAQGINRPVIITAKKDTVLPFDLKDLPVIFYDRLNLKEDLEPSIEKYIQNQQIEMKI